jgi:hypothetical protein
MNIKLSKINKKIQMSKNKGEPAVINRWLVREVINYVITGIH